MTHIARKSILCLFSCYILFSPAYSQVLEKKSPYLRSWVMYAGYGRQVCDLRFVKKGSTGEEIPIERLKTLGYDSWRATPKGVRRIVSMKSAIRQGRQLCKILGTENSIHLYARCGSARGWRKASNGTHDLCSKVR